MQNELMFSSEYKDRLSEFISNLESNDRDVMLYDYIFDWMAGNMTDDQLNTFIDTGEW